MASYSYTFTSGDSVTPTNLNSARTVSEIVNADINASAAIAGTKIAPDFGNQDVTVSGKITLTKPAVSVSNTTTTPAEFIRLGWQEATQDLGLGEGCAINFAASLVSDGGTFYPVASVASFKEDASESSRQSSLNFFTSSNGTAAPTERMRINSSGNVGIGTASPSEKLHVVGDSLLNGLITSVPTYDLTTTSSANMAIFSAGTMRRSTSLLRFKDQIENADKQVSEAIVYSSRPVWFRSKCDGDRKDWSWWGFIAEEIAEIDPRLVHWGVDENGNLRADGVQYDRFVPHLCAVVKDQRDKIAALETRLAALEAA